MPLTPAPCAACHCAAACPQGLATDALLSALQADDLDAALELGLLRCNACGDCSRACAQGLPVAETIIAARDARLRALAARERYRARDARLERRARERAAARAVAPTSEAVARPALPTAAAAALARAKAKAAAKR